MNKKLIGIAICLIMLGIVLLCYPWISNYIYQEEVEKNKEEFTINISEDKNKDKLYKLYQELKSENEKLYKNKQENLVDPFSYEQQSIDLTEYGIEDSIVAYINIPKMDIELPILLGASNANMKKGAVHLTETSYPIGGKNTNSVIAAHRGMSTSAMFRNIDKLEIGDEIIITNVWEELKYKVCEIKIITPDDIEAILIQEGRELITLITCHPYRHNYQRYVVYAEKIYE